MRTSLILAVLLVAWMGLLTPDGFGLDLTHSRQNKMQKLVSQKRPKQAIAPHNPNLFSPHFSNDADGRWGLDAFCGNQLGVGIYVAVAGRGL